jgi:thiol-disulfide isomerase/thioredoxin
MVTLSLGLSGCSLFQKKGTPPAQNNPDPLLPRADTSGGRAPDRRASAESDNPIVPTGAYSGILAGQVIDSFSRPMPDAYVLVKNPKQEGKTKKAAIDIAANSRGYFTISGLTPGVHYQLTARARDGRRMMAGITWASPPNPRVLIRISEDFVSKNTPPIPPPPAWPGSKDEKTASAQQDNPKTTGKDKPDGPIAKGEQAWMPGLGQEVEPKRNESEPDQVGSVQAPVDANPAKPVRPDSIADSGLARNKDVPLKTPPLFGPRPKSPSSPVVPASRVPSCILAGNQLTNFALYDLDNKPWEFRQRTGKVVLLDFWGTRCGPCLGAIPNLKIWQDRYRKAGLQVIGIAYENEGSAERNRRRVDSFCQQWKINYRVLMGCEDCPVLTSFHVTGLPTLILLDQNGWVIYRHTGRLPDEEWLDLERRLRQWLGLSR